jgi:beta-glucanase (GH16 family)
MTRCVGDAPGPGQRLFERGCNIRTSRGEGMVRISKLLAWTAMPAMVAVFVLVLPGVVKAAPARPSARAAAVPGAPPGWTLTWADDFNGCAGCGVDTNNWKYDTGTGFGTGEIETMTSSTSNVFQDGAGHLVIRALHSGSNPTSGWTSGRIETQSSSFGAAPGGIVMMQSSIQQPNLTTSNGLGYWPAFWMLGAPLRSGVPWPSSGEVDILEDVNNQSAVYGTLHCGSSSGGPCNEPSGIGSGARACGGCQTGYHTYAVQIDRSVSPEQIRWYLDGNNYFTVFANQVDATTWANAVDHPFFIIYDLALGGGFPNGVCGCTTPTSATASGGQMNIDYVAVYNKAPGSGRTGQITGNGGKCVDVAGANTADGTHIQLWTCNGTNAQQWTWNTGDSTIRALGKCMDVTSGGTANGTKVQLWTCNGTGAQVWQSSNGSLFNPQSARCLDDPAANTTDGTQLQIWDCNGTAAQVWHMP